MKTQLKKSYLEDALKMITLYRWNLSGNTRPTDWKYDPRLEFHK